MHRLAHLKLILTARETRRKIWASLPFSVRIADVLYRFAVTSSESFGKTLYGIFLLRGVRGMPDVNGMPAQEWLAKYRDINRLPNNYGSDFGEATFKLLAGRFRHVPTVEDMMGKFALKFWEKGAKYLEPGMSLTGARSYVVRSLLRGTLDVLKRQRWETPDSALGRRDEGLSLLERTPAPVPDDEEERTAIRNLRNLPPLVRAKLRLIHPSAEQYLQLVMDGHSDVAIFGNESRGIPALLDHPYNKRGNRLTPSGWTTTYWPKIEKLLRPLVRPEALEALR